MDAGLRRAWTEIVTPDDYDSHMAAIGQAQAAAEHTAWIIESAAIKPGNRITIAGAGTGQMLDFLDPGIFRPYRLTFADLNPAFLTRLTERLARCGLDAEVVEDDIERTALQPESDLLIATLLLEHIDWPHGVTVIGDLEPRTCGIILQENPPGMTTAMTPGRRVPASIAKAMEIGHPTLMPRIELVLAMGAQGYAHRVSAERDVADGKRLAALLFRRSVEPRSV